MLRMASIFCSIVTFLKEKRDNAGCYLCSYLILSLPSLRLCTGIKIIRYDSVTHRLEKMSVKSSVRRSINQRHDIKRASDMAEG